MNLCGSLIPPGSGSLSLSMVSTCSLWCMLPVCLAHAATHQHELDQLNFVYTKKVKRPKSGCLVTTRTQSLVLSQDLMFLQWPNWTFKATPMKLVSTSHTNYLQKLESKSKFLSNHFPFDVHILGDIQLNLGYYTLHFFYKAEVLPPPPTKLSPMDMKSINICMQHSCS
jgi:hypothetical protein